MSTGLAMQVAQRLEMALTPQMIQSMELLQMPLMQLEQRLRQEQLENPILALNDLEEREAEEDSAWSAADDGEAERENETSQTVLTEEVNEVSEDVFPDRDRHEGLEHVGDVDYNWDDVYDDYASPRQSYDPDDDEAFDPIANAPARPQSLSEHLHTQLAETPMSERIRALAGGMVENLDARGWLTDPLETSIPKDFPEPPPTAEELKEALLELQKLDPDGIGARDLSECLELQLLNRPERNDIALGIVKHHLEDLAANRLPKMAKDLKCSLEEIKEAGDLIRTLNPHPGAGFSAPPPPAIRPELVVDENAEGEFTVRLTSGVQPQISDFFTALFDNSRRGKILRERMEKDPVQSEAFTQFKEQMRKSGLGKKFREKYNNAQWLVKAVAQREKTLLSVATEIVDAQQDYLAERTPAPAPLFMQDIANRVGYDISTVSRAVKDKYIDTPLGIKPLKDFFARTSGVATPGEPQDASTSNASVLLKIKEMIEAEDKRRPLRDNEIMERLAADGIQLKRRSIVNYREKLGYASHSHRKEY